MTIEPLARLGYASKALIYLIVGTLAIAAAARRGGRVTDTSGALRVILSQPFGQIILIVLAVGLCGYAAWRFLDAWQDPDRHGTSVRGLVIRIGNVLRGAIYGGFGFEAFRLLRGMRGSSGREAEMWTARVMELPLGGWLVGITGAIVAVYGASQIVAAVKKSAQDAIDVGCIPGAVRDPILKISRFGIAARGLIIMVLGIFLVRAAMQHDPSLAAGTRESIIEIANAVQGRWLLATIGAGLIGYAVNQVVHAKCRKIRAVV